MSKMSASKWPYAMSMDQFERLDVNMVKVSCKTSLYECDQAESWISWIELISYTGKIHKVKNIQAFVELFEFDPGWDSLFRLTVRGVQAREALQNQREYEREHADELAEYTRLKEKYDK